MAASIFDVRFTKQLSTLNPADSKRAVLDASPKELKSLSAREAAQLAKVGIDTIEDLLRGGVDLSGLPAANVKHVQVASLALSTLDGLTAPSRDLMARINGANLVLRLDAQRTPPTVAYARVEGSATALARPVRDSEFRSVPANAQGKYQFDLGGQTYVVDPLKQHAWVEKRVAQGNGWTSIEKTALRLEPADVAASKPSAPAPVEPAVPAGPRTVKRTHITYRTALTALDAQGFSRQPVNLHVVEEEGNTRFGFSLGTGSFPVAPTVHWATSHNGVASFDLEGKTYFFDAKRGELYSKVQVRLDGGFSDTRRAKVALTQVGRTTESVAIAGDGPVSRATVKRYALGTTGDEIRVQQRGDKFWVGLSKAGEAVRWVLPTNGSWQWVTYDALDKKIVADFRPKTGELVSIVYAPPKEPTGSSSRLKVLSSTEGDVAQPPLDGAVPYAGKTVKLKPTFPSPHASGPSTHGAPTFTPHASMRYSPRADFGDYAGWVTSSGAGPVVVYGDGSWSATPNDLARARAAARDRAAAGFIDVTYYDGNGGTFVRVVRPGQTYGDAVRSGGNVRPG